MKFFLASIAFLLLFNISYAQNTQWTAADIIKSFLHDVHETDMDAGEIGEKYIWFNQGTDAGMKKRYQQLTQHIAYLRLEDGACEACEKCQNCKIIFKENKYRILRYSDLSGIPHVNFGRLKDQIKNNIYAVVEGQKVLQYFFLHDAKIASFYYLEKGGEPFFLQY